MDDQADRPTVTKRGEWPDNDLGLEQAMTFEDVCPRLARAHAAEGRYQERLAKARRTGLVPMDVAMEEMIRGCRAFGRAYVKQFERFRARWDAYVREFSGTTR